MLHDVTHCKCKNNLGSISQIDKFESNVRIKTTFKINAVVQQLVLHDKSYHVTQVKSEQVNQGFGE
jgi:hypothetical protein